MLYHDTLTTRPTHSWPFSRPNVLPADFAPQYASGRIFLDPHLASYPRPVEYSRSQTPICLFDCILDHTCAATFVTWCNLLAAPRLFRQPIVPPSAQISPLTTQISRSCIRAYTSLPYRSGSRCIFSISQALPTSPALSTTISPAAKAPTAPQKSIQGSGSLAAYITPAFPLPWDLLFRHHFKSLFCSPVARNTSIVDHHFDLLSINQPSPWLPP